MYDASPAAAARLKRFVRRSGALVGSVMEVRTRESMIALTYDDGPEPSGTDTILDALAETGTSATFFVLVSRARLYPALLAEVVAAGHEVALHGLDHQRLTGFAPAEVYHRSKQGRAELEDLIGRTVRWVRPPYGRQSFGGWRALRRAGLTPVLWGPSSLDSREVPPERRIEQVRRHSSPGSILLCHDGYADARDGVDDGPAPVLDRGALTRELVELLDAAGLRPGSLSSVLDHGAPVREARFRR